jgi:hypothetical protein
MHGMCNLYDRGRCKVLDPEKSEKIVDLGFDEFIRMMDSFKK